MSIRASERAGPRPRRVRLTVSATASTFVVALPLILPTVAAAHASGKRLPGHAVGLHAAQAGAHGPHSAPFHPADLTVSPAAIRGGAESVV